MGINFGGYEFDNPVKLVRWIAPYRAGIYLILAFEWNSFPPFRPIYVGESENMSESGFIRSHHKYQCWINQVDNISDLYMSALPLPKSTKAEREKIESMLISLYDPICNRI
ncbi:MAG: hypothetical protein OEW69_08970 [Nitrospirota bacterium]|nr:hypothetical protein [Nitrospirota bacterium]MDH5743239.1 hypothetical protein [Candidatus Aminicenantes bacterium]